MTYPVNDFDSKTYSNISANGAAPTAVFDTMAIPQEGYALVLGIIASNKSAASRGLNLTLRKNGAAQAAHLLFDVALPSQTAFQIIDGDKLVVKRGDVLSAWGRSDALLLMDGFYGQILKNQGSLAPDRAFIDSVV